MCVCKSTGQDKKGNKNEHAGRCKIGKTIWDEGRVWREKKKREKDGLGNYWTRLGSCGNLSGARGSCWWGCGRQDQMERGLWLCSLKLVTRLLPSPWAECEMRLARPNVLHMHHLCHKTNLITVNYGAAIIRRGPCHTQAHMPVWIHKYILTQSYPHTSGQAGVVELQHLP